MILLTVPSSYWTLATILLISEKDADMIYLKAKPPLISADLGRR